MTISHAPRDVRERAGVLAASGVLCRRLGSVQGFLSSCIQALGSLVHWGGCPLLSKLLLLSLPWPPPGHGTLTVWSYNPLMEHPQSCLLVLACAVPQTCGSVLSYLCLQLLDNLFLVNFPFLQKPRLMPNHPTLLNRQIDVIELYHTDTLRLPETVTVAHSHTARRTVY